MLNVQSKNVASMTAADIWAQFIPADSFANEPQFKRDANLYAALTDERDSMENISKRLLQDMAIKGQTTDSRDGSEVLALVNFHNEKLEAIAPKISEIGARQSAIYRTEALKQITDWHKEKHEIIKASPRELFRGFNQYNCSDYGATYGGRGFIASMQPLEYIKRISYEIFGVSVEQMTAGIRYDNIKEYALQMLEGVRFDCGYIDYIHGTQEGRHRAIAAHLLGVERIPVYIIGR